MSCILAFYLGAAGPLTAQTSTTSLPKAADWTRTSTLDPDALYAERADVVKAKQAAEIWLDRAQDPKNFDAAWKLARACYYLGTQGPEADRRFWLDRGVTAGKQAAAAEPTKPDGHFWLAANEGRLAESLSRIDALKYKNDIKAELEKVIAIEPGWQSGSAESALGQWYIKVPSSVMLIPMGGDRNKGIAWLRKALTYNPESTQTKFTLAQTLADDSKTRPEAKTLLQQVIDAPVDPEWAAEDLSFKAQARDLLAKLNRKTFFEPAADGSEAA